jgi:hypothetical protein
VEVAIKTLGLLLAAAVVVQLQPSVHASAQGCNNCTQYLSATSKATNNSLIPKLPLDVQSLNDPSSQLHSACLSDSACRVLPEADGTLYSIQEPLQCRDALLDRHVVLLSE